MRFLDVGDSLSRIDSTDNNHKRIRDRCPRLTQARKRYCGYVTSDGTGNIVPSRKRWLSIGHGIRFRFERWNRNGFGHRFRVDDWNWLRYDRRNERNWSTG